MAGLVWEWIQTQLLGMQWLSDLVGTGLERMGLDLTSRLGGSIQFFLYDVGENLAVACDTDLCGFLRAKLFSAAAQPPDLGAVPGIAGQCVWGTAGDGDPLLLLFFHSAVYGLYGSGDPAGGDLFLPDLLSHGGLGQPGAADEYFRRPRGGDLCGGGTGHCGMRRHPDSEAASGRSGGAIRTGRKWSRW